MANPRLTHHEELRYNYLMSNLNYLSPKEQEEFNYLRAKVEAYNQSYDPKESYYAPAESGWQEEPEPTDVQEEPYQEFQEDQSALTSQGLPVYDDANSYYRQQKNQARAARQAAQEQAKVSRKPVSWKKRIKRSFQILAILFLLLIAGLGYRFYKGYRSVTGENANYQPAITEEFIGEDAQDGTNILILGSDKRVTQQDSDARTDTIMVVNVGNSDNKVKMVSFMRDTLVNIPGVSSYEGAYDQKLNVAFNLGEQDGHKGADYVRQVLKDNFDIPIKYYVMLDFETFATAIDTLFPKGVKIDAQFATVGGETVDQVEVPDDLNMKDGVVPNQTIKVSEQRMDGRTLLNYARFRKDDEGDFGRTKRQQQVMSAVISQLKNPTKLLNGSEATGKIFGLTSTNLPYSFLLTNGLGIMTDASKGIERQTIPENGDWVDAYDMYGGQALSIDFDAYKAQLKDMGMR